MIANYNIKGAYLSRVAVKIILSINVSINYVITYSYRLILSNEYNTFLIILFQL